MSKSTIVIFTCLIFAKVQPVRTKVADRHTRRHWNGQTNSYRRNLSDLPTNEPLHINRFKSDTWTYFEFLMSYTVALLTSRISFLKHFLRLRYLFY